MVYEVAFKFVPPETLQTLHFAAQCRQTARETISIHNPLSTQVNFKCEASHPDITFMPAELVVPPCSEASVEVVCRPVLPGTAKASLTLRSSELGDYPYAATVEATAAGLEKTIVFKAPLGSRDTVQTFKFLHYARKPAQYAARIEPAPGHQGPTGDFSIETKDIKAAAATDDGLEVMVDIRFEPSSLGEIRALVVLSSPDGGDYKALLVGYTQAPQPQGPVVISKGKGGVIDFQNPFNEGVEFNVQVDNPSFVFGNRSFKLDGKKSLPIQIQFNGDKPVGARLTVTTTKVPNPWTYYLKGTI